jgi:hypothetical protein
VGVRYWTASTLLTLFLSDLVLADEVTSEITGTWEPGGRAYQADGNIEIKQNSISWKGCKNVPYEVLNFETGDHYPGQLFEYPKPTQFKIVLIMISESACFTNERYIQIAIPNSQENHADFIFYASPEAFKRGYIGWSGFGKVD